MYVFGTGLLIVVTAVILAGVPALVFSRGVAEGKAYPVTEGQPASLPEPEAKLFTEAGIPVSDYSMKSYTADGARFREYTARTDSADLKALDDRVAAAIDELRQSMPSLRDLVARFGNPTFIMVRDEGATVFLGTGYGSVTFLINATVSATIDHDNH